MDDQISTPDGYNVCMRKTRQGSECSMSSQRVEEIVSALMKPIKDLKQNFDIDLSLLEEYLTEAGLRHLNEGHNDDDNLPNFAEVALLLQQTANIYGLKVDYLWLQVRDMLERFGSSEEEPDEQNETPGRKKPNRSKRKVELTNFELIDLEEATNINLKEIPDPKPLPVLPKTFIQFEPRVISENDVHIKDYKGEIIGVVTDFRCNWNTDPSGTLCDDLDFCPEKEIPSLCSSLVDTSVPSPPDSGHCSDSGPEGPSVNSDTPVNMFSECMSSPDMLSPVSEIDFPNRVTEETKIVEGPVVEPVSEKLSKKRKLNDGSTPVKPKNSKYDMTNRLSGTTSSLKLQNCCFSLPSSMIEKIVERRKNKLKKLRRRISKIDVGNLNLDTAYLLDTFVLKLSSKAAVGWHRREILKGLKILATDWEKDFIGFHEDESRMLDSDITGFRGFSPEEFEACNKKYSNRKALYSAVLGTDINTCPRTFEEDLCNSDYEDDRECPNTLSQELEAGIVNRLNTEAANNKHSIVCSKEQMEIAQRVEEWHASIRANLAKAERRKDYDVWSYGCDVLTAFKREDNPTPVINFSDVLRNKPKEDIARYFLSTLMLANTSNVEIIKTDPIGCRDFKLHLLSMEKRFNSEDVLF